MASDLTARLGGARSSLAYKAPCAVATTANITLTGAQTIDDVAVIADDRVLVKNQTNGEENGIYIVKATAWARAKDFDSADDVTTGTRVYVWGGTLNVGDWIVTTEGTITIGSTNIVFARYATLDFETRDFVSVAAATAETIAAGVTFIRTAGYYEAGDGGHALYARVGTEPAHGAKLISNDGGWWEIAGPVLNPLQMGAVGDGHLGASATDDTTALQLVLNYYRDTQALTGQRNNQRVLDLVGRQYRVSASLSLEGCDGVEIRNGTLLILATDSLAVNRAILEHDIPANELWGFTLRNVTIQCNQVANGLLINRPQECLFDNPTILGWGQREYGARVGPEAYSADTHFINPRISGFAETYADNPPATRTGYCLDLMTADTEVQGGGIDTGLVCIRIWSSASVRGAHIWTGHPPDETLAAANGVGIEFLDNHSSTSSVIGCTLDNACIKLVGQSLFKQIVGNHFYGNQTTQDYAIVAIASATGQTLGDNIITDNHAHGYYDKFMRVDQTSGTYTSLQRMLVKDNLLRTYRTGYNTFPSSLSATQGSITFFVGVADFDVNTVCYFDLGSYALLLPAYGDATSVTVSFQLGAYPHPSSLTFHGAFYDEGTGLLHMKFSSTFNGIIKIDFDQSYMSAFWPAA